jgi:hypothetical protein
VSELARLSYQQAEALFREAPSGGATLHQLRHAALTHDAEDGPPARRCCWPARATPRSGRWPGTPAPRDAEVSAVPTCGLANSRETWPPTWPHP